ncbi:MAG: 4Fe-4S dicluster domain-containing protein [Candidatus Omnitrophica bacterium]|nr:4Fe-4S dicluster domain-containing protein [Candidatus Omnitrophota bacterium]
MPRWGMVIDLDKCTGCQACVVACKQENNVPYVGPDESARGRTISWMKLVPFIEGEYPHVKARFMPRPCMHCDNPPCVKVCPVQATYKNQDGVVGQIYPRCIGCRYCTTACPYTLRYFNWYTPAWDEEMKQSLNPDVSIRPKGVVEKCTFCHHRLQKVQEKARIEGRILKEDDYIPACVQTCPADAMYFGDLDNPEHKVWELARSPRAFKLLEEIGTLPKVIYLMEGEWQSGK